MAKRQWIKIAAIAVVGAVAVTALVVGLDVGAAVGAVGSVVTALITGAVRAPKDALGADTSKTQRGRR